MKYGDKEHKKLSYELYKIDWIDTHISYEQLISAMRAYTMEKAMCYDDSYTFDDYLFDNGFGYGDCYVCYDEFLKNEYQDEDYIKHLMQRKESDIYED